MLERDAGKPLTGRVGELDDAYLGGERPAANVDEIAPARTPFLSPLVETTLDGKPVRLKLRRVTSFCSGTRSPSSPNAAWTRNAR